MVSTGLLAIFPVPSLRATFTLALVLLEEDVPYPALKGNCVQSLWCYHTHFKLETPLQVS